VIRRAILTIVALLCLTSVGVAQTLTFPPLTGRVVDEAGLLSPGDRATVTLHDMPRLLAILKNRCA
jgi:uncharacterized membrane protein YgcG